MMSYENYKYLRDWLLQVDNRLDAIEAASGLPANSEQPLVGPPGTFEENSPRSPDRETFTKLKRFIERYYESASRMRYRGGWHDSVCSAIETILKYANDLDHGDEHKILPAVQRGIETSPVKPSESEV